MRCSQNTIKCEVGILLTGLTPPHIVPITSQALNFQRQMLWSLVCSVS